MRLLPTTIVAFVHDIPKSVTNAIPVVGVTEHDITIEVVIIEDDDVNAIDGDDDDVITL